MWVSNFSKNMKIVISYKPGVDVERMVIWNYNGRDTTKGAKDVEIYKTGELLWKGTLLKGSCSLKTNFSTHINFSQEKKSKTSSEFFKKKDIKNIRSSDYLSLENRIEELVLEMEEPGNKSLSRSANIDDLRSESPIDIDAAKLKISKSINSEEGGHSKSNVLKLLFKSNWGDTQFVGLRQIQLLTENDSILPRTSIESFTISTNRCSALHSLFDFSGNIQSEDEPWCASINALSSSGDLSCGFDPIIVEIVFKFPLTLNGIVFWNYNKLGELNKGLKTLDIHLDNKKINNSSSIVLHKAVSNNGSDFSQTIKFPLITYSYTEEEVQPFRDFKPAALTFKQDYETPYLPTGFIVSFILISNWGNKEWIGLKKIELYDQNGKNLCKYLSPKINSSHIPSEHLRNLIQVNSEGSSFNFINKKFIQNEGLPSVEINLIFERPVSLSAISIINQSKEPSMGVKDLLVTIDESIIYKGCVKYNMEGEEKPTSILFTSDLTLIPTNLQKNCFALTEIPKQFSLNEDKSYADETVLSLNEDNHLKSTG